MVMPGEERCNRVDRLLEMMIEISVTPSRVGHAETFNAVTIDLLILDMIDFDVILGMTWLSPYYIVLNCNSKTVTREIPSKDRLEWEGVYKSKPLNIISLIHARSVFGYRLFGLLLSPLGYRDIDFCIDLDSITHQISIGPYHMAPVKLRELKTQVQELLDKEFIRSSSSPWGCSDLFFDKGRCYNNSFVKSFASNFTHLSRLTQNEVPFAWSEQCEESFQRLDTLFTTTLILRLLVEGRGIDNIEVNPIFIEEVKAKQSEDENLDKLRNKVVSGETRNATLDAGGVLSLLQGFRYENRRNHNKAITRVFHCLQGDGGPICGALRGIAALEVDAMERFVHIS
ncbi:hypothetical protein MTR67_012654 [Solanum verrucosum]|uniref:Uncharacterized protein n=1 Tax=Solanum verrucosum TaxID=315347 RepID=A0AAF0THP4_SOLVR|nr:hypothetical protein MTR67_012654 [Solanum verrucosum]